MRKAILVALSVLGIGMLALMPASAVQVKGAGAMLDAFNECSTVESVAWRCRTRCYWRDGRRICRRHCNRW